MCSACGNPTGSHAMQNTREQSTATKDQRDHAVGHRHGPCLPRLCRGPGAAAGAGAAATQPRLLRGNHETINHHKYTQVPEGCSPLPSGAACGCAWGPGGTKLACMFMQLCSPSSLSSPHQPDPWVPSTLGPKNSIVIKQL